MLWMISILLNMLRFVAGTKILSVLIIVLVKKKKQPVVEGGYVLRMAIKPTYWWFCPGFF